MAASLHVKASQNHGEVNKTEYFIAIEGTFYLFSNVTRKQCWWFSECFIFFNLAFIENIRLVEHWTR